MKTKTEQKPSDATNGGDARDYPPSPGSEIPEWLREIVSEGGKFPRPDENIPHVIKWVFDSHRQMCTDLQECVQRHNIGLPGESVDAIVIAEIDRLLSHNVERMGGERPKTATEEKNGNKT